MQIISMSDKELTATLPATPVSAEPKPFPTQINVPETLR
jgi:hypothetical protein